MRPACDSGSLPPLPAAGREDLRLPLEHLAHLLRVEARERAVGEADVLAALGEAPRELVLRDGDAFALEVEPQGQPVDAARDARVGAERLVAHLHVDEVVGDEEVPLLRELADALGPELDGVVAARDELVAVLAGTRPRSRSFAAACLLRGDVAADALGARLASCPGSGGFTMTGTVIPSARTSISKSS